MGLSSVVIFSGDPPSWGTIRDQLQLRGLSTNLRMIDGLPAFPDEIPESTWHELRVTVGAGMLTLKRSPDGLQCVVWGNADSSLQRAQNVAVEIIAELTGGVVAVTY